MKEIKKVSEPEKLSIPTTEVEVSKRKEQESCGCPSNFIIYQNGIFFCS
jgi:hypothetical protein